MRLYGYQNDNGEIKQAVIEVEEKTYLVPKTESGLGYLPFCCGERIERKDIGVVKGYFDDTIFFLNPEFEKAKAEFLKRAELRLKDGEDVYAKARDAYEKLVSQKEIENEKVPW